MNDVLGKFTIYNAEAAGLTKELTATMNLVSGESQPLSGKAEYDAGSKTITFTPATDDMIALPLVASIVLK